MGDRAYGQRGLAVLDGEVRLFSRNGMDITRTFPDVSAALSGVGRPMVLDGEFVALDDQGRPCFQRLQRRWPQSRRPARQLVAEVPVRFFVFDVLHVDGAEVRDSAYRPGRSPDWVKTPLCRSAEVVVVGWVPGAGPNSASVGSLLLAGRPHPGRAGRPGWARSAPV